MIYNEGKRLNSSERFGKWILEKTGFERLHQQLYEFFADTIKKLNYGDDILDVIKEGYEIEENVFYEEYDFTTHEIFELVDKNEEHYEKEIQSYFSNKEKAWLNYFSTGGQFNLVVKRGTLGAQQWKITPRFPIILHGAEEDYCKLGILMHVSMHHMQASAKVTSDWHQQRTVEEIEGLVNQIDYKIMKVIESKLFS